MADPVSQRNPYLSPRVYVLVLAGGESIMKKLNDFASLAKIQSGSIMICVGDIENVRLSDGMKTKKLKGARMICSASGNVSQYGSKVVVSVVSSKGLSSVGELVSGQVVKGGSVEFGLLEVPSMAMKREQGKGTPLVLEDPAITWVPVANSRVVPPPLYESALNVEHIENARQSLHYDPKKEVPGVGIWPDLFHMQQKRKIQAQEFEMSREDQKDESTEVQSRAESPKLDLQDSFAGVASIQLSMQQNDGPEKESSSDDSSDEEEDDLSEGSCNLEELCSSFPTSHFEAQPGTREVHETAGQVFEVSLGFSAPPPPHPQSGNSKPGGRDVGLC